MTDNADHAHRRRQLRISTIWIVPAVAVLIGAWMIYDSLSSRGPLVTLEMRNAEGIEAGKTQIKARNVQVGQVETVRLSEDLSHAIVEARLRAGSERMLNTGTRFWVVKPRIGREGISGLSTVLSGAYIQLLPGNAETAKREFEVLDQPPVASPEAEGLRLELVSALSNSLSAGDPVIYEGLTVGRVASTHFDPETRKITHRVFVRAPYDSLVTDTTRFWKASGVNVGFDSNGVKVDFESLESLLGGGITFGVPDGMPQGDPVKPDTTFELYANVSMARAGSFDRFIEYVLLIKDTVRGLNAGAPVEYRGIRVGTVVSVPWELSLPGSGELDATAVPVLIRIEPRRLEPEDSKLTLARWRSRLAQLVQGGLRASLESANLLTGSLFVDLHFPPDAPAYEPRKYHGRTIFPVTSTGVAQIEQKLVGLLDKLNALQVEGALERLNSNLEVSRETLTETAAAARTLRALLDERSTQALPAKLNDTLAELQRTLEGFSSDSEAYSRLMSALERFDAVMQDLRPLVRTLREQPNALIFDKRDVPDPQPRAPR